MKKIYNIDPATVAEWMSLIDPSGSNDKDFEQKVAAILKSQADLLLNSEMTEVRAKHWILSKQTNEDGTVILEFNLIAYSSKAAIIFQGNENFIERKIRLLKENLLNAIANEDYLKAAEMRDLLRNLEQEQRGAA